MENNQRDPYPFLFPMGIFSGGFGALMWLAYAGHLLDFYPRQAHANLMFFCFLWSFVAGFLMTAIPRMTQTDRAKTWEISIAVGMVLIQWCLNFFNWLIPAVSIFGLQTLFLILFIGQRFQQRRRLPFEGFVFLPFALLSAIGGLAVFFFGKQDFTLLYLFSGQAFVLNLICGLGSRLIPLLSRVPAMPVPDAEGQSTKILEMLLFAILLNLSFLLEALAPSPIGVALRTVVLAIVAVRNFKILKKPMARSFLGRGLRFSVATMILGYLVLSFDVLNPLTALHLVFVGGLGLLTLMVATRVTVAHGGENTDLELRSHSLRAVTLLLILSALARVKAGSEVQGILMILAALCFLAALIWWFSRFFHLLWPTGFGRILKKSRIQA